MYDPIKRAGQVERYHVQEIPDSDTASSLARRAHNVSEAQYISATLPLSVILAGFIDFATQEHMTPADGLSKLAVTGAMVYATRRLAQLGRARSIESTRLNLKARSLSQTHDPRLHSL